MLQVFIFHVAPRYYISITVNTGAISQSESAVKSSVLMRTKKVSSLNPQYVFPRWMLRYNTKHHVISGGSRGWGAYPPPFGEHPHLPLHLIFSKFVPPPPPPPPPRPFLNSCIRPWLYPVRSTNWQGRTQREVGVRTPLQTEHSKYEIINVCDATNSTVTKLTGNHCYQ